MLKLLAVAAVGVSVLSMGSIAFAGQCDRIPFYVATPLNDGTTHDFPYYALQTLSDFTGSSSYTSCVDAFTRYAALSNGKKEMVTVDGVQVLRVHNVSKTSTNGITNTKDIDLYIDPGKNPACRCTVADKLKPQNRSYSTTFVWNQ